MTAYRIRHNAGRLLIHLTLAVGSVFMLIPFFWLLSSSLKAPHEIYVFPPKWIPDPVRWSNYREVFEVVAVARYTANTMIVTIFSTVGVIISSSMAAYSFARLRFKGRDIVFGLILSTVMLPYVVTMIPVYILFTRLGWIGTYLPLIVPDWFGGPITIFLLRQFFRTIPLELEDAARIDGASRPRIFAQIILPLARPALTVVLVLSLLYNWNDFLAPLIYLHKRDMFTLALGLNALQHFESGLDWTHYVMVLATLMVLPVIIVYFLAQRAFVEGIVLTGLKG
ncbi:MAG: carbohydrate ABC transporter permease [Caldilineaceae bacterium]|nr:carbohydrate ABC transporter permease [Caldilineaceae bacterium]MCY3992750.1 carbohydrate ABC transporter permease [Caldilineaceae bacterium]MDE0078863.1 carbohydrate ABC transporter permease [Caldilineaceae bacterium]